MSVPVCRLFTIASIAGVLSLAANAGSQTRTAGSEFLPSRVDLFAGYSFLHPEHADVGTPTTAKPIVAGALLSGAGYFSRHLGVQGEVGLHPFGPNDSVYTAEGGPIFRYQLGRAIPFVHGLAGAARTSGPDTQPGTWGFGVTAGGGLDIALRKRFAVRVIQVDYNYNQVDYGPLNHPISFAGGLMQMQTYSISAGLTARFGEIRGHAATSLSCSALPDAAYEGEPVTIHAAANGLDSKKKASYAWTTTGGQIVGTGPDVQVNTAGLAAGSYTVSGRVMQGSKAHEQASCSATFRVKQVEAPTITCSASPTTITPGESSNITAQAASPSGRPLTYTFSSDAGQITGTGASALLSAAGAAPGEVVVTCAAVDDKGQSATAHVSVNVIAAPLAAAPAARSLCPIRFDRDARRPARVDNEGKACLDDIALTLQRERDSRLVMVGSHAPTEDEELSAERAANAMEYLVREKGIDSGRLAIRTNDCGGRTVETLLLPAGATLDDASSRAVVASAVKHRGEAYGRHLARRGRKHHRHGRHGRGRR